MTRRSSVRAQAQEIYCERVAKADAAHVATSATPLPGPPPQGGRGQAESGEGAEFITKRTAEDLTAQVRALYEGSAVPVREIAALAGVTERTIYKYARKHHWNPRYRWRPEGARPQVASSGAPPREEDAATGPVAPEAAAARGQSWQPGEEFAPAKGAGGRFISRADLGLPVAVGLKATDPAGRSRAGGLCEEAAALAEEAEQRAQARLRWAARQRVHPMVIRAASDLNRYLDQSRKKGRKLRAPGGDPVERALHASLAVTLNWWESLFP